MSFSYNNVDFKDFVSNSKCWYIKQKPFLKDPTFNDKVRVIIFGKPWKIIRIVDNFNFSSVVSLSSLKDISLQ